MEEEKDYGEQPQVEDSGSPVGKFSDAKALLDAYNNLQAEFTKKCQKLSDLVKEREQMEQDQKNRSIPQYEKEGWKEKVQDFIKANKYASKFINEIADTLIKDDTLSAQDNCLDLAYKEVLASHFKTENEIASADDFLDKYILNNEDIKMRIITKYIEDLNRNTVPTVISSNKGSSNISSNTLPKTLKEAGDMVKILFKS